MGHEGTHFNLHANRFKSAAIGMVSSSFVPFHLDIGFAISHNQHHRFTNTDKDPDVLLFRPFDTFWKRLFLARRAATQTYAQRAVRIALNQHPPAWDEYLNLPRAQIVSLARLNITLSALYLLGYIALALLVPGFALSFAATVAFAFLISGLRPYLEHAGTDVGLLQSSQSWISGLFDTLYGGINYHLAHHLSPGVPAYRIKAFHHWLVREGHVDIAAVKVIKTPAAALQVLRDRPYGSEG
jgi:fatty acid desaturase